MWFKWLLIVVTVFDVAGHVAQVGKPTIRTASEAALEVLLNAAIIAGILYYWGR